MRIIKKKKIIDESYRVNPIVLAFNSAAFTGFAPIASGTVGSFVAACVLLINVFNSLYILLLLSVLFFLISLFTGKGLLKRYGDDPSVFVMDEVIGMWVTIIVFGLLCQKFSGYCPEEIFVAFILFRIFDIIKLPPVRYFDNMKNVFGVLTDDVIAGIQAGVIEFVVILLIKLFI